MRGAWRLAYYNQVRSHASLKGHMPLTFADGHMVARAGWRTRSSATRPSSAMALAPGVQLGRGVRSSSACEILNRLTEFGRPVLYRLGR